METVQRVQNRLLPLIYLLPIHPLYGTYTPPRGLIHNSLRHTPVGLAEAFELNITEDYKTDHTMG
mgnify:CR=1 FL=1